MAIYARMVTVNVNGANYEMPLIHSTDPATESMFPIPALIPSNAPTLLLACAISSIRYPQTTTYRFSTGDYFTITNNITSINVDAVVGGVRTTDYITGDSDYGYPIFLVSDVNETEFYLRKYKSLYIPDLDTRLVGGFPTVEHPSRMQKGSRGYLNTDAINLGKMLSSPIISYRIDFDTNGGTAIPSKRGTKLPDPLPTTTREGYRFNGWFSDRSLIFPAIPGADITEDTVIYAGWRSFYFDVAFNTNGGEPLPTIKNVSNLPLELPVPKKLGNAFIGWFTDSSLTTPAVPGSPISQDTTLYAKWEEIQSTDIHVPAVNTPSLLQSGFVTMWQPTLEEVRSLSSFLWTTNIFDNLRKLFNDPMEALLFLGIIPFDPTTSERGNIYFGNLDSEVESTPIVQQYYTLDFGDIDLSEYYNSFLDYAPNTYAEVFLPFCGTHRLSINEIMGATINVKYNVDVFTGTCLAMLTVTKPGLDSVMYSFEGNLMATIPVTAKNYSDLYRRTITGVASIVATAALGGLI